jgi:acyl-coenzyme A synthetase/AMP-(fatty) acid ligase
MDGFGLRFEENTLWPLLDTFSRDRTAFWTPDGAISQGALYALATTLAEQLPNRPVAAIYCEDRVYFTIALLAAWMRGQTAIFPPDSTAHMFRLLSADFPNLYCLTDIVLPFETSDVVIVSDVATADGENTPLKELPATHPAIVIFTSGSSGKPSINNKTWGMLVAGGKMLPNMLGLGDLRRYNVVATAPSQHMYGFETGIMSVLQGGAAVHSERPVFPSDIARCLDQIPLPRILVTTPIHLRSLVESGITLPALCRIVSATAPLSQDLARRTESQLEAPVWEIYGFTEVGSVARRQTMTSDIWSLREDFLAGGEGNQQYVDWSVFNLRIPFPDEVDILDPTRIRLRGRAQDSVNIAGKRASLSGLSAKLMQLEGVVDGTIWQPDEDEGYGNVSRLIAFVVAPESSQDAIRRELRQCMDPVFVPRRIFFVETLGRNATGKLPQEALRKLTSCHLTRSADQ